MRSRTPQLLKFGNEHNEINKTARCLSGGLECLANHKAVAGMNGVAALISSLSPHWGALMPFSDDQFSDAIREARLFMSQNLTVKCIANCEGYLDCISGALHSIGNPGIIAKKKIENELKEESYLIDKFKRVLGGDFATLPKSELICLEFFVYLRNRVVHTYGNPSPKLVSIAESKEFKAAWNQVKSKSKGRLPSAPTLSNDKIEILPEHGVLASIIANRLVAETDRLILVKLGQDGLWKLCVRHVLHFDPPATLKDRISVLNALMTSCRGERVRREKVPERLRSIDWWDVFKQEAIP